MTRVRLLSLPFHQVINWAGNVSQSLKVYSPKYKNKYKTKCMSHFLCTSLTVNTKIECNEEIHVSLLKRFLFFFNKNEKVNKIKNMKCDSCFFFIISKWNWIDFCYHNRPTCTHLIQILFFSSQFTWTKLKRSFAQIIYILY